VVVVLVLVPVVEKVAAVVRPVASVQQNILDTLSYDVMGLRI